MVGSLTDFSIRQVTISLLCVCSIGPQVSRHRDVYWRDHNGGEVAELITSDVDELGDFWAKAVYPYTAPIVGVDRNRRPSPVGSAIVVACYGRKYLLTAHHVTATHLPGAYAIPDSPLYAYVPQQWEISGTTNYFDDPFDLSMTEISPTPHPALRFPQHFAFDVRAHELCLIFGFPARSKSWHLDQTRHTLRPAPLSYLGSVFTASAGKFTVRLSRKNVHRSGKRLPRIGKLEGISGGGAFVLRNDAPKLAGIVIEYHSNSVEILCTSCVIVREMVRQLGTFLVPHSAPQAGT